MKYKVSQQINAKMNLSILLKNRTVNCYNFYKSGLALFIT